MKFPAYKLADAPVLCARWYARISNALELCSEVLWVECGLRFRRLVPQAL